MRKKVSIPSGVNATCHGRAWGQHRAPLKLGKIKQAGCRGDPTQVESWGKSVNVLRVFPNGANLWSLVVIVESSKPFEAQTNNYMATSLKEPIQEQIET